MIPKDVWFSRIDAYYEHSKTRELGMCLFLLNLWYTICNMFRKFYLFFFSYYSYNQKYPRQSMYQTFTKCVISYNTFCKCLVHRLPRIFLVIYSKMLYGWLIVPVLLMLFVFKAFFWLSKCLRYDVDFDRYQGHCQDFERSSCCGCSSWDCRSTTQH